jgi:hypothetical protein
MVAVLMVVTGCAAAPGVAEPTPTPVVSSFPSPGAASPETSPATTAPSSAAASEPTPTPIASYPPSTTGHGPDPLYGRAEPIPGTPDAAAADALAEARRQLEAAGSYQLWMSIAGDGPAAEGLEPGEPLILSGIASVVTGQPAAAWSVTSPPGYARRSISYVVRDSTVWCDSGVGIWTIFEGEQRSLALDDAAAIAPPVLFQSTFLDDSVDVVSAGLAAVGDRTAIRFDATDPGAVPLPGWWLGMDGEVEAFVLWVTDQGEPLQAELAGTIRAGDAAGKFRMLIQVAAIDDPANRVEPPA